MVFRSKIHWKSVLPCFPNRVCQKCETNFLEPIQIENFWIKNVTNLTRHHFWCHQYSSHKLAIISQLNVVLSHYLFSTITVIYVLQSFVWLTSNESYVMTHNWWVIAVFYLYIDHCHEHVSWTVAIHNILHQNCLFIFNDEWGSNDSFQWLIIVIQKDG